MSLNQLPDELIAHIGTFLSSENNCQLAQSQKRIHHILKRDGLTKPEVYEIRIYDEYSNEYKVYKTEADCDDGSYIERTFDEADNSFSTSFGKILKEVQSTSFTQSTRSPFAQVDSQLVLGRNSSLMQNALLSPKFTRRTLPPKLLRGYSDSQLLPQKRLDASSIHGQRKDRKCYLFLHLLQLEQMCKQTLTLFPESLNDGNVYK